MKQCKDCKSYKKSENCIQCFVYAKKRIIELEKILSVVRNDLEKLKMTLNGSVKTDRALEITNKLQENLNGN